MVRWQIYSLRKIICKVSYTGADRGRASKWAAAIVMAKIYMKQQNWQAGLNKCMENYQSIGTFPIANLCRGF